ncbi:NADH-quinone oxidoreductase subunit C [Streptomyces sp. ISL-10]|uniref:NADH-quinone oxidoreductase subunit C n=1 Tax=Streptomyces sp. ISL-10 TaxID=2819172 RepID=UPI001BE7B192|nr:NADH-quinone oxidoreductase subunit C [Streptomyces sp. ISL-10]MBT2370380.1 NADH-quinone oxidoreductase subunit C [Streptomyces sp. ISL-10]
MNPYDTLPDAVTEIFGEEATAERSYELLTVDVPADRWIPALETARDELGCTYFDWLSAVDEPGIGFRVCAHVVSLEDRTVRRLLLRTTVPHGAPSLATAVDVYAGASWHERETHEMFGVEFTGHPQLDPLLLPEGFEGHPLRKDFVLAARVAKAWPGAKEPGESEHGGPKRRQMLPPGVPDPNEWGPLKGQLPPAPARPARTPRAAAATGDRPPRRSRSVSEGSASQAVPGAEAPAAGEPRPARRSRSASEGSASQAVPGAQAPAAGEPRPARRSRSASEGSATQRRPEAGAQEPTETPTAPRPRSSDAPWHHARPAFGDDEPPTSPPGAAPGGEQSTLGAPAAAPGDEQSPAAAPGGATKREPGPGAEPGSGDEPGPGGPRAEPGAEPEPEPGAGAEPERAPEPEPGAETEPAPSAEPGTEPEPAPGAEPAPSAGSEPGTGARSDRTADHHEPNRPAGGDPA